MVDFSRADGPAPINRHPTMLEKECDEKPPPFERFVRFGIVCGTFALPLSQ
jgi:hypothetical protein